MNYQFPHSRGTPPGRPDIHRVGGSCSVRRQRLLAAVGVVVVLVVVGAFALRISPWSSEPIKAPLNHDVAPESARIAFTSHRDGDGEIYVMNADGSDIQQLTHNDYEDYGPAWSPDGNRIGFISDRDSDRDNNLEFRNIYVMNADGTNIQQLTDGSDNQQLAWSPDGNRIAFTSVADIYVMNADGSDVQQITNNRTPSTKGSIFFSDRDGDNINEPYIRYPDGSFEPLTDITDWDDIDWDAKDGMPSWSPDGRRIAFMSHRDGDFDVYVMNDDGSNVHPLTHNDSDDYFPAWSPDGSRMAFVSRKGIYVMNADGSDVQQLTDNEYGDDVPAWSPDGRRIALNSRRGGGETGIYVMNIDGTDVERLTDGYDPTWSPVMD